MGECLFGEWERHLPSAMTMALSPRFEAAWSRFSETFRPSLSPELGTGIQISGPLFPKLPHRSDDAETIIHVPHVKVDLGPA